MPRWHDGLRRPKRGAPLLERLKFYSSPQPGGCWRWHGTLDQKGYGVIMYAGKKVEAYRAAYEVFVGPVPAGLELDHKCRNRACINPAHLEPVSRRENVVRGVSCIAVNARKTHCKAGHPFTGDSVRIEGGHVRRRCVKCQVAAVRRYRDRIKAGQPPRR